MRKTCFILVVAGSLFTTNLRAWAGTGEKPASVAAPKAQADTRPDLEVIARVNGDPVTRLQFDQMVGNPITLDQAQRDLGIEKPEREDLERVAMKRLIQLRLLVQEAARRKITVTQDELDQTISDISHRFESLKDFGAWIKDQGLNDPLLFETVRADLLATRATAALTGTVKVTDEETQAYYEKHREALILGTEVRLRIIAVSSRAEAEEIQAAVKKGAPFDLLARNKSRGRLAARGGDTGWVNLGALPPLLQEAAARLEPLGVSPPLEKGESEFLIVGLQDRRPILATSVEEARAEIHRRLLPQKQQEFLQEWLEQQEEKSTIELVPPVQAAK